MLSHILVGTLVSLAGDGLVRKGGHDGHLGPEQQQQRAPRREPAHRLELDWTDVNETKKGKEKK